jgi:3-methyl-2-oxobutanoate hydroxymethyltransferase
MPYSTINSTSTANTALTKNVTINTLNKLKANGEKFVVISLYDARSEEHTSELQSLRW